MQDQISLLVALEGEIIDSWKYFLIKELEDQDELNNLEFLHLPTLGPAPKNYNWIRNLHLALDKRYFQPQPDAFAPKPWPSTESSKLYSAEMLPAEKKYDFIIWLSESQPRENHFALTQYGILHFVHDFNVSESVFGYSEFMERKGVISSRLVLTCSPAKSAIILDQSWSVMPNLSLSRARNAHMWKLSGFIPRALTHIAAHGISILSEKPLLEKQPQKPQHVSKRKAFFNLLSHFCRMGHKSLRKLFYREQWILMIHSGLSPSTNFKKFTKILPPKDKFWADPFLVQYEGKNYLFFEELLYATDKGHLCVAELGSEGIIGPVVPILEKEYHLSYPFIFELAGRFYLIPESYEAGLIQLYECKDFPKRWEHKMNLMENVEAFDTTLFFHDDSWWMFTVITTVKGASHNDELYLFYADAPFTTEWKSHPQNPVVNDVRRARPAGRIYRHQGKIMRPSQDCSRKYGYGFRLNEIEILNKECYQERTLLHVTPDQWDEVRRTHSYNFVESLTVIDALIQRPKYF